MFSFLKLSQILYHHYYYHYYKKKKLRTCKQAAELRQKTIHLKKKKIIALVSFVYQCLFFLMGDNQFSDGALCIYCIFFSTLCADVSCTQEVAPSSNVTLNFNFTRVSTTLCAQNLRTFCPSANNGPRHVWDSDKLPLFRQRRLSARPAFIPILQELYPVSSWESLTL